jgi:hypothetical protein
MMSNLQGDGKQAPGSFLVCVFAAAIRGMECYLHLLKRIEYCLGCRNITSQGRGY